LIIRTIIFMSTQQSPKPAALGSGPSGYLGFERPLAQMAQDLAGLESAQAQSGRDLTSEVRELQNRLVGMTRKIYSNLTPWETVQVARHPHRPSTADYIDRLVKDFTELRGDRNFRDDRAIITGFGRVAGKKVMIVGHMKGRETRDKIECCFGCAHPEGYRKALLKMKLAAKFHVPIVCFVDTPGAYPGVGAEERGQAQAIAVNLMEMSRLQTPIVIVVLGEGGSGGALGIGVGDRVAVMEHAYYSVISPEGCAAILWKSAEYAEQAATCLKITSRDLKKLGLIDDIVPEPLGGAHRDQAQTARNLEEYLTQTLRDLTRTRMDTLLKRRYERLRTLGSFFERVESATDSDGPRPTKRRSNKAAAKAEPASASPG
jgi:acetyl-CoA carboxylase carboxyl transferase subunit alpha